MNDSTDNLDFVKNRLNSIMNEIMEGIKGAGTTQSHNVESYSLKRFTELHKQIKELFPDNQFLPNPKTLEEIYKEYQYGEGYYLKSTIREIADALGIVLEFDRKPQSGPIVAQYQSQSTVQVNLQNLNNVIECINNLQLEWEKKETIVKLTREFEEAEKENNPVKLRSILKKVGELSPKAAAFLVEHAAELKILSQLLGL